MVAHLIFLSGLYEPIVEECILYGGSIALWTEYEKCDTLCDPNGDGQGIAACVPTADIYGDGSLPAADEDCPVGTAGCPCNEDLVCASRNLKCRDDIFTCVKLLDGAANGQESDNSQGSPVNSPGAGTGDGDGPDLTLIIGLAIVGLCVILIIALTVFLLRQRKKRKDDAVGQYLNNINTSPAATNTYDPNATTTFDTPTYAYSGPHTQSTAVAGVDPNAAYKCDIW